MKLFKRLIAGSLSAIIMCCANVGAAPRSELLSFSGDLNQKMLQEIPAAASVPDTLSNGENKPDFTLSISASGDDMYTGTGYIRLESGVEQYTASGELKTYTLSDGNIAYIGALTAEVENGLQGLYLNVHSVPASDKMFVLVNASIKDDQGQITDNKVYAFGEVFDEMNEFVPLYAADTTNNDDGTVVEESAPVSSRAAADYNPKFASTKYGTYGNSNGYYDLIAVSAFAPKRMKANGMYYMYAKVNSNDANARSYARKYLTVGAITDMSVTSGTVTITAEKKGIGFTSIDPTSKTLNVSIPVPFPSGEAVGIKWFKVAILKINAEMKKSGSYNSDNTKNQAYWWFDGNNSISWTSKVLPKDTEKAYAGQGYLTNFNNLSYETTANIEFAGTLDYRYVSQYGATQYTGTFGTSTSYNHSVTLDKS